MNKKNNAPYGAVDKNLSHAHVRPEFVEKVLYKDTKIML
jgi:hypothetical protein